jgi:hypothetical protein
VAPRQWAIDVSVGATACAVGAGGVLALVVAAGLAEDSVWSERWWWISTIVFAALTLIGVYMLAAVYFPFRLPETRASREAKANVRINLLLFPDRTFARLEVAMVIGHLDIQNASVNVRVPDWVQISACDEQGVPTAVLGEMASSPESLDEGAHGINYWRQADVRFSAFTAVSLHYRLWAKENHGAIPFEFE